MSLALRVLLIVVFSFLGLSQAFAQTIEERVTVCASLSGESKKVECYDKVARDFNLTGSQPPPAPPVPNKGKWGVAIKKDLIDDSKMVELSLKPDSGSNRWGEPIYLIIRCKSSKTELFIIWNDYLGRKAYVTTRIGNEKAKSSYWTVSNNEEATFYAKNVIRFVQKIMSADKFVAQVAPYSEGNITAVFDTRGLSNTIVPLRQACGW